MQQPCSTGFGMQHKGACVLLRSVVSTLPGCNFVSKCSHQLRGCLPAAGAALHSTATINIPKHVARFASSSGRSGSLGWIQNSSLHSTQKLQHRLHRSSSKANFNKERKPSTATSSSDAGGAVAAAPPAAEAPDISPEQQAAIKAYLAELSEDQQLAAYSTEQHVRVIAGPGSGKTRVVAARIAHLIANGALPESILVITFTRKAARELLERLQALLGPELTQRLRPCTFHSLCTSLLRRFPRLAKVRDFQVATEDDCENLIAAIINNKLEQFGQALQKKNEKTPVLDATTEDESEDVLLRSPDLTLAAAPDTKQQPAAITEDKSEKETAQDVTMDVTWYRRHISNLKNFCKHINGRSGQELIAEMSQSSHRVRFLQSAQLARVYDLYINCMQEMKMLDFDDLLHHSLSLVKEHPKLQERLHGRWQHVLVDESQDTNLCQFELVTEITGPQSNLFMVGDPDQAIYGFRGANSKLLSKDFLQLFGANALTRTLAENYRCREPIVAVADMVRSTSRLATDIVPTGRSKKPQVMHDTVMLMATDNEFDEADQVILQLKEWQRRGYAWDDMAALTRNNDHNNVLYKKLIEESIPCHRVLGADFFEAVEVKTAIALLRCVVAPQYCGDEVKQRLIKKGPVHIPLMKGLGTGAIGKLEAYLAAYPDCMKQFIPEHIQEQHHELLLPTLGNCLFGDIDRALSSQEAGTVAKRWSEAEAAGSDSLEALQALAPEWGFRSKNIFGQSQKQQMAVINGLRGLVLLARTTVALGGTPAGVLQVLLDASGIQGSLDAAQQASKGNLKATLEHNRRCNNLKTLVRLAINTDAYAYNPIVEDVFSSASAEGSSPGDNSGDNTVSSSSPAHDSDSPHGRSAAVASSGSQAAFGEDLGFAPEMRGINLLQQFYDYCALQGDSEDSSEDSNKVQLLTMHRSKGLEFPCVAIMRAYEGSIPSYRKDEIASPAAVEQERNLLYVAITRAQEHCLITWPKQLWRNIVQGDDAEHQVSSFLESVRSTAEKGLLPGVLVSQRHFVVRRPSNSYSNTFKFGATGSGFRGSAYGNGGSSDRNKAYAYMGQRNSNGSDTVRSSRGSKSTSSSKANSGSSAGIVCDRSSSISGVVNSSDSAGMPNSQSTSHSSSSSGMQSSTSSSTAGKNSISNGSEVVRSRRRKAR